MTREIVQLLNGPFDGHGFPFDADILLLGGGQLAADIHYQMLFTNKLLRKHHSEASLQDSHLIGEGQLDIKVSGNRGTSEHCLEVSKGYHFWLNL